MKFKLLFIGCCAMNALAGEVKFRGEDIMVDGKPFLIRGGEMHPQRIPREYWRHRVRMSCDYGAPISEQGLPTKDYYRYREILAREVGGVDKLPSIPEPIPTMENAMFTPSFLSPLTSGLGEIIPSESSLHFNANNVW